MSMSMSKRRLRMICLLFGRTKDSDRAHALEGGWGGGREAGGGGGGGGGLGVDDLGLDPQSDSYKKGVFPASKMDKKRAVLSFADDSAGPVFLFLGYL